MDKPTFRITVFQTGELSRREYRLIVDEMSEWCQSIMQHKFTMWYRNNPNRSSMWTFIDKNDAMLFKLKFGGQYEERCYLTLFKWKEDRW